MALPQTEVIEHRYEPRGTARTLLECRDDEVLMAGPAGTGKSRGCLEKLHLLALMNPGMRGLMVRKTAVSMTSTGLVTWREHVVKEAIRAGLVTFYGGSRTEAAQYRYTNGSTITVGGMDYSSKIMSSEYDVVYVQEATELTEDNWEAITTRLRNWRISFQQIIADCNPDAEHHWLNQRCNNGKTTRLLSKHEDNPLLFDDDGNMTERGSVYMHKLDNLTGVRRLRLRDGLWVSAEGIVYEGWDPTVHLIDRFRIPYEWPRVWVVDFGFTNPFVCQMWARDPDGRMIMYREIYHTKKTVDVHALDILNTVSKINPRYIHPAHEPRYAYHGRVWHEPKPTAIICDHDSENREVLAREIGIGTTAAHKSVDTGIEATAMRMQLAGDGRPRVMIMHDSVVTRDPDLIERKLPTCTAEEIPGYVWLKKKIGTDPTITEEPLKKDDHGCDCLRYLVANEDLAARPRVRSM